MEFDFGLAGKNILLYGGHSNIGRFATYGFAKAGAHVTIAARDMKSAQEVCDEALELGAASARCIKCDTTSYEETKAAADFALENTGRLDSVYHGVAWDELSSFLDLPREYWDRLYEVNFKSVMNAWHYIIPIMIKAGGGNFVNVASVMGRQHATEEPVYGALKSAVIHLGQTIALEHGKDHIRINFVAPGPTPPVDGRYTTGSPWAEFFKHPEAMEKFGQYSPMGQVGNPAECGYAAVYLASEVTGRHLTGQIIGLDGGWYMPK